MYRIMPSIYLHEQRQHYAFKMAVNQTDGNPWKDHLAVGSIGRKNKENLSIRKTMNVSDLEVRQIAPSITERCQLQKPESQKVIGTR